MSSSTLQKIRDILPASEILQPGQPDYTKQSAPWSPYAELHPKLVVQPTSLDTLGQVVKLLYDSDLDFAVRNTGTGSVSASDVILSMHGFKDFSFDEKTKVVTIGAGFDWGEVDALMEDKMPGYQVVGARCTWVGVTGSALVGGLSWLSHEFGMISDPQNLLDMQIVLSDGRAVWASEHDPELMWALRGGGGNFGVVTALRLQARPYPMMIFAGLLTVPYSSLRAVAKAVAIVSRKPTDPKLAMHIVNQGPGSGHAFQGPQPGIQFIMYDGHGESHARSDEGFKWAFDLPGAQEVAAGEMPLSALHKLADTYRDWQGNNEFFLCAPLLTEIDEETVIRAWKWYEDSMNLCPGLGEGSAILIEWMQKPAFASTPSRTSTGWPHGPHPKKPGDTGQRHVMQLALGCPPSLSPPNLKEIIFQQFQKAATQIGGPGNETGEFHAGFLHPWNDLNEVYGENLEMLKMVKTKYDPRNRFNKGVDLANQKVTPNGITLNGTASY